MTQSEGKVPVGEAGWGTIIVIYLLCVMAASTVSQVIPIAGDIARYFHPPREQVGWIISLPSALVAIGAVLVGWVIDRVGDKPAILVGAALMICGDLGAVLAETVPQLLAMRVVEGLGYVGISVGTVTLLTRATTGRRRTSALTLWSSFVPMSFALPLVLAGLLAGTGHWRWAFGGHALITLVLALAGLRLPGRSADVTARRSAGLSLVLRTPACYALGVSFALAAFVQTGIVTTLPQVLAARYGVSIPMGSGVGTIGMLFNTAGCLLMGPLFNRGIPVLTLVTSSVLLTAATAVGVHLAGLPLAASVAVAWLFFFGSGLIVGFWALLPSAAPSPQSRGAASGLVAQLTHFGVLFGPPAAFAAMGVPVRQYGNTIAALAACAALLWMVVRLTGTRRMVVDGSASH